MKRYLCYFLLVLSLLPTTNIFPQANQTQDKMKWWKEARFGMFIHWGLYSVPAGIYNDKEIGGLGEWIMNTAKIPVAEYEKYASQFNPEKFNAEEWVKLAKSAGMKYIVITSKHHDGFAMFKSNASSYNIVDATPFKRDVIAELAAACKKYNIAFGLYYSQAQDWHAAGGAAAGGHWDKAQDGDMDKYLDEISIPQVKEILSNYGDIKVLWFDTPENMTPERAAKFMPILQQHPDLIYNNRLGGGINGDLETPEQFIPATGYPGNRNWESCMTINGTWGFKSFDHNWKSTKTLVRNLIDIASKGGNYLLNVGPTSLGQIPDPSVIRLKQVGEWMDVNNEAIYATKANPFKKIQWGRCTHKTLDDKELFYFHIFDFPQDGKLTIPGLVGNIYKAYPLSSKNSMLNVKYEEANPVIDISSVPKDSLANVIVVEISKDYKVYNAPEIKADYDIFINSVQFGILGSESGVEIHYTTDGSVPTASSPLANGIIKINPNATLTLKTACFLDKKQVGDITEKIFTKEIPKPALTGKQPEAGIKYKYYEGEWRRLPDFKTLEAKENGVCKLPDLSIRKRDKGYGIIYSGYINVPETNVYQFQLGSTGGSTLKVDDKILLNDRHFGMETKVVNIALEKGLHEIELQYFQFVGANTLELKWKNGEKQAEIISQESWSH